MSDCRLCGEFEQGTGKECRDQTKCLRSQLLASEAAREKWEAEYRAAHEEYEAADARDKASWARVEAAESELADVKLKLRGIDLDQPLFGEFRDLASKAEAAKRKAEFERDELKAAFEFHRDRGDRLADDRDRLWAERDELETEAARAWNEAAGACAKAANSSDYPLDKLYTNGRKAAAMAILALRKPEGGK